MKKAFVPGCALMLYDQELAEKIYRYLRLRFPEIGLSLTCCRNPQTLSPDTEIISICPGCIHKFESKHGYKSTSIYDVILSDPSFPYPDYHGAEVSIQDACPTRHHPTVQAAVRQLLENMHLCLIEPPHTRENTICCGDVYWNSLSREETLQKMQERGAEMPCEDVVVYCVSCIKALHHGGKTPRYLMDLLFSQPTALSDTDPLIWHGKLNQFIEEH